MVEVFKVLRLNADGELTSFVVPPGHEFFRIYKKGISVEDCLAFDTFEHAQAFGLRYECVISSIWLMEAEEAMPVDRVILATFLMREDVNWQAAAILDLETADLRQFKRLGHAGDNASTIRAPKGTVFCRNATLKQHSQGIIPCST